jgi:hypothetical protein
MDVVVVLPPWWCRMRSVSFLCLYGKRTSPFWETNDALKNLCKPWLIYSLRILIERLYACVMFIFWKTIFIKLFFKFFCVCLSLKKIEKFEGKFGRKTIFRSCEKFRNIILFADYIKFDSQTFDCCIYLFFNFFS